MKHLSFNLVTLLITMCFSYQANAEPILKLNVSDVFTNPGQLELIAALGETNFARADAILRTLSVDFRGADGRTVLWWAVNLGDFRVFEYLLKKGANPNHSVSDTRNTVELCAAQEDSRFLQMAIEHGANVNRISGFTKQTPIFRAIVARCRANVETLIKNGAYLDIADPGGITPLLWAAHCGAFDLVVLLLKHGANPEIRNNNGLSVLDIVRDASLADDHPLYRSRAEALKLMEEHRDK